MNRALLPCNMHHQRRMLHGRLLANRAQVAHREQQALSCSGVELQWCYELRHCQAACVLNMQRINVAHLEQRPRPSRCM